MKAILILMDSLNRNYLNVYNENTWVKSPNICEFAKESIVFDKHFIASAPCMPARRDLMTGRPNFLERCWGPVEAFDITMQQCLRQKGVFTHIVTDHCHYMDRGGENYLQEYNTWDYIRGQEYDGWVSRVTPPAMVPHYGTVFPQYELNKTRFIKETDFPTPKTFQSACKWVDDNKNEDNFFLQVEVFDPHEPFDAAQPYLDMYPDAYHGPYFNCSTYEKVTEPAEAIVHLQKRYAACISMADYWFGIFIKKLKEVGWYDDTLIILTTDHGHLLGEHGFTGKNFMHGYNQLVNIPLLIHIPEKTNNFTTHSQALTQTIDLPVTLLDYFNCIVPQSMRGESLMPLLLKNKPTKRDAVIFGWFGSAVNIYDGRYSYFRAAQNEDNKPLFNYCSTPTTLLRFLGQKDHEQIDMGRFLSYTEFPVYKIPAPFPIGHFKSMKYVKDSLIFDCDIDYLQEYPIYNKELEDELCKKLVRKMLEVDSPREQYSRLGLEFYVK